MSSIFNYSAGQRQNGIVRITKDDISYPEKLKMHLSDYKDIYVKGDISLLDEKSVAIVGSRKCSVYGKTVAFELAKHLVKNGVSVISGLAYGIDREAHLGALNANGKTVAVIGTGIDVFYPSSNKNIQEDIGLCGCIISEYANGVKPMPYHFPTRNRIISAVSDAVVVVEAGTKSGALITAELACEQGKPVYAIPGNITSANSLGTNKLIRDGATPLIFFDDLIRDLGLTPLECGDKIKKLGKSERYVYNLLLKHGEMTIEEIYHKGNMSLPKVNGIITTLEIKGLINYEMGKVIIAN